MSREIFEIIIVTCIILIPVVFYISYIIDNYRYYKVFKNLSMGDGYDWIVQDIDDPFELPHTVHYKIVNKKSTSNGWIVQIENKSSRRRKAVNIKYLIENYTKV